MGNYSDKGIWGGTTFNFLDSDNFIEKFGDCTENSIYYGNYKIEDDFLNLNYSIFQDHELTFLNKIDSLNNNSEEQLIEINLNNFNNSLDKNIYIEFSDYLGKIIRKETDYNGIIK
jgi:hypothetical protein